MEERKQSTGLEEQNKKNLFDGLSNDYDLGTYDEFIGSLEDEGNRRSLFDAVSGDYDLGTWEDFNTRLGYGTQPQDEAAPKTTTPPQGETPYISMAPIAVADVPEQYRDAYSKMSYGQQFAFSKALARQQQMATPEGRSKAAQDMRTVAGNLPRRDPRRKQFMDDADALDHSEDALRNPDEMRALTKTEEENEAKEKTTTSADGMLVQNNPEYYHTKREVQRIKDEQYRAIEGRAIAMGKATNYGKGSDIIRDATDIFDQTDEGKVYNDKIENSIQLDRDDFILQMAGSDDEQLREAARFYDDFDRVRQEGEAIAELSNSLEQRAASLDLTDEQAVNAYNADVKAAQQRYDAYLKEIGRYENLKKSGAFKKFDEAFNDYITEGESATKPLLDEKNEAMTAMFGDWIDRKSIPLKKKISKDFTDEIEKRINERRSDVDVPNYLLNNPMHSPLGISGKKTESGALTTAAQYTKKAHDLISNDNPTVYANSLAKGFVDNVADMDFWTFGLNEVVRGFISKDIMDKVGEDLSGYDKLTDDEKLAFDAMQNYYQTLQLFQPSGWYTAGQVTADALPFIVAMWGSGGIVNAIKGGAKGAEKVALRQAAKQAEKMTFKQAAKNVGKAVGNTALEGAVYASTTGLPHTVAGTLEYLMPKSEAYYDLEEGGIKVERLEKSGESVWSALAKSWGTQMIEGMSEAFSTYGLEPLEAAGYAKLFGRTAEELAKGGNRAYKDIVRAAFKKGSMGDGIFRNISSFPNEYIEEIFGGFLRCMTGLSEWDDEFNGQTLAQTAYGLLPMQVVFSAMGGANLHKHRQRMRQAQTFLKEYSPETQGLYDKLSAMSTYEGQDLLDREILSIQQEVDALKQADKFTPEMQQKMAARMNAALVMKEQLYMDEAAATIKDEQQRNAFETATSNLNKDNGNLVVCEYTDKEGVRRHGYVISQDGDEVTVSDGKKRFKVKASDIDVTEEYTQEDIEYIATNFSNGIRGITSIEATVSNDIPNAVTGEDYTDNDGMGLVFEGGGTIHIDNVDDNGNVTFTINGRQATVSRRQFREIVQQSRNNMDYAKSDINAYTSIGKGKQRFVAFDDNPQTHADFGRGGRDARAALAEAVGEERVRQFEDMGEQDFARAYAEADPQTKALMADWMEFGDRDGHNAYRDAINERVNRAVGESYNMIGDFVQRQSEQDGERARRFTRDGLVDVAMLDGNTQVVIGATDGSNTVVMDMAGNRQIVDANRVSQVQTANAWNLASGLQQGRVNQIRALETAFAGTAFAGDTEYTIGIDDNGKEDKVLVIGTGDNGMLMYATEYHPNKEGEETKFGYTGRSVHKASPTEFRDMVEGAQRKARMQQLQKEAQEEAVADQGDIKDGDIITVMVGDKPVSGEYNFNVGRHFVVEEDGTTHEFKSKDEVKEAMQKAGAAVKATQDIAKKEAVAQRQVEMDAQSAMEQEYQRRLDEAKTPEERAQVIQEFIDQIKTDETVVFTADNMEEVLSKNGVKPETIAQIKAKYEELNKKKLLMRGFFEGSVRYLNANDITDIENARSTYVHERQHGITRNNVSLLRAIANNESRDELLAYVQSLSGSNAYDNLNTTNLADEFISMAMEVAYSTEDVETALRQYGINNDALIQTIIQLDNEQRTSDSLAKARRGGGSNLHGRDDAEGGGRHDGQDSGREPEDVGEQRLRPANGSDEKSGRTASQEVKTPEQLLEAFIAKHGDNTENKLNKTIESISKDISSLEKKLATAEQELKDLPEAYNDKAKKAIDKKEKFIEKVRNDLEAARKALAPYTAMKEVWDSRVMANQTRLNEADQALQDLDTNLNPTVEAEEVHKFDKEPANADEAAADFLVGFVKKEHRINEQSLMQETGWSEDEVKNFRPATTPDGGMTLQEAAENLYAEYESEGSEHGWFKDPSEARDKLISVMQEAGKYGELANYINQRRGNDKATQQMQAALDANAQQLGYADAQDMHDKRMTEAQAKLEELKDEQGNLSEEALQQFKDFTQGLMIGQEETPTETPAESIEGGGEFIQPTNEEAPFSVVLPIDQQTPKNTTIDQVLYSIKVNHNSPYLLKKADGSFIDPETGERLGFDHRFMNTGEGAQAHGWGSYFSVNDLANYGYNRNVNTIEVLYNGKRMNKIPVSSTDFFVKGKYVGRDGAIEEFKHQLQRETDEDRKAYIQKRIDFLETTDAEDFVNNSDRHHYDVEIPDNDNDYYLEEDGVLSVEDNAILRNALEQEILRRDEEGAYKGHENDLVEELKAAFPDNITGRDAYGNVSTYLGGDEQASKFLKEMGYYGIHYDGQSDGECYVIFDENDAKIVDHVMFSVTGLITNEQGEIDYDRVTNLAENNEWQQASRIPQAYRLTSVPANAATIISQAVSVKDRTGSEASRQRGDVQGVRQGDRGDNNQGQPDKGGNGTPLGNLADTIKSDIEAWAKSQGYWYDEARLTDGFTEIEGGTESRVFVNADKTKARKLTSYPPAYGEYMQLLMENIGIFNATFPDAAYEVIGFGKDKNGNLAAVVEQPYIEGRQAKDRTEVVEAMRAFGFRPFYDEVTFTNGRVFASDVNEKNMVIDTDGKPHVIDAVMSLRSDLYDNSDILYSVVTPQQDADYMDAVNRGDMETAQRMVNEAAMQAGYNEKAYHGTSKDFTKFQLRHAVNGRIWGNGYYFAEDEKEAENWGERGRGYGEQSKVMPVYLSLHNPLEVLSEDGSYVTGLDYDAVIQITERLDPEYDAEIIEAFESGYLEDLRGDKAERIGEIVQELGYDGVIGSYYGATHYMVFSPSQIKSADPVTYDDKGNVIPLSERFNEGNDDIRYSVVSPQQDAAYMQAVESGDMEAAQRMVDEAAREAGYISGAEYRMMHRAPGRDETSMANAMSDGLVPKDYWTHPEWYQNERYDYASFRSVKSAIERNEQYKAEGKDKIARIRMYRAIPKGVKEDNFRNGDWVTPSEEYARQEGQMIDGGYRIISLAPRVTDLWWDGNDINEWGYDDGKDYAYQNTKNNRKLLDAVTYDDDGNVIPLSKRFNKRSDDIRYSFVGFNGALSLDLNDSQNRLDNLDTAIEMEEQGKDAKTIKLATGWERGKDGQWRYEIPDYYNPENMPNNGLSEWNNKMGELQKESNALYKKYTDLLNSIPAYIGKQYTDEQKAKFKEMRKQRDKAYRDYLKKQREIRELSRQYPEDIETSLPNVIGEDNPLLVAYPKLKDTKVIIKNLRKDTGGSYDEDDNTILINARANRELANSTLAHEIQHAIQDFEGFAQGGNPAYIAQAVKDMDGKAKIWSYRQMLDDVAKQNGLDVDATEEEMLAAVLGYLGIDETTAVKEKWIPEKNLRHVAYNGWKKGSGMDDYKKAYDKWLEKMRESGSSNFWNGTPFELYKRLAGETEARNVQTRLGFTEEQRRQLLAAETEDVAREDQLVMFAGAPVLYSVTANEDTDMGKPTTKEITTEYLWRLANEHNLDFQTYSDAVTAFNQLLADTMREIHDTMLRQRGMRPARKLAKRTEAGLQRNEEAIADEQQRAMNEQREYDKATANRVMRLAQMLMRNGRVNELTRGEVSRLMSAMKNATPQGSSMMDNAMKIVDVMVQHQLRDAAALFGKQLRTKTSKLNASGVETQAGLDLKGQRIIKSLRDALKVKDAEAFNELLRKAVNDMGNDARHVSENATLDYAGLLLAKQYKERIEHSVQEEKSLKAQLREQQETIYDFDENGNKTLKNEYKDVYWGVDDNGKRVRKHIDAEHKAQKQKVRQLEQTTEEALRDLRMERIDAYAKLSKDLADVINDSRTRAKQWAEQEQARVQEIQHNANSDLQGKPDTEQPLKWNELSLGEKAEGNMVTQFLMAPTRNFNEYLRFFGDKSPDGRGYLWNRFMRQAQEARDNEWANLQRETQRVNDKISEIFGGEAKTVADLMAMERKMPKIDVKYRDGSEEFVHHKTQGEALYIYMANKMADGAMKLRAMGILEEDVDRIAQQLDPRLIEFADWVQQDFLPSTRERYNEVHERMFGAPMANITDYFPLKVNDNSRREDVQLGVEFGKDLPSTVTSAIIARKRNITALDLTSDAFTVLMQHVMDMEHWAAYAELSRDLGTLLSYKRFRNRLNNMSSARLGGRKTTDNDNSLYDNFVKVCNIVCGTYHPKQNEVDKFIRNVSKGVTSAKINFRIYTALKQITSEPAFWTKAAPQDIAKNLLLLSKDDEGHITSTWKWAVDNLPGFARRWQSRQSGNEMLDTSDTDWGVWKSRFITAASRYGMTPNAFIDALTVIAGSKAVYDTALRRYTKEGYDSEQAKQKALLDAGVAYNESQQSNDPAYLSIMQSEKTVINSMLSIFRNASFSYGRLLYRALHNTKKMLFTKDYKENTIEYLTKQGVREGLTEQQAKEAATKAYNRQWWHNVFDTLMFGYIINFMWYLAPYATYLLGGDDDKKKKDYLLDVTRHGGMGAIEGMPFGSVASTFLNDVGAGRDWSSYSYHLLPIVSDIENVTKKFGYDKVAAYNDVLGLLISMFAGVDPRGLTDIAVAIVDACNGDPETSMEAALLIMRISEVPQSQLDQLMIDELGITAGEAKRLPADQLAQRYAAYKMNRNAPLTRWAYDEEQEGKVMKKHINRFMKMVAERTEEMDDIDLQEAFTEDADVAIKNTIAKQVATEMGGRDTDGNKPSSSWKPETQKAHITYQQLRTIEDVREDVALRNAITDADPVTAKELNKLYRDLKSIRAYLGDENEENDKLAMERLRAKRRMIIEKYNIKVE